MRQTGDVASFGQSAIRTTNPSCCARCMGDPILVRRSDASYHRAHDPDADFSVGSARGMGRRPRLACARKRDRSWGSCRSRRGGRPKTLGGRKGMRTAVVGLGYVGLPLSLQFARSGVTVLGLDIDPSKVDALNQGQSYIKHITPSVVAEAVRHGSFSASTRFQRASARSRRSSSASHAAEQEPRAGHFATSSTPARHRAALAEGQLVVLESTTYPGTTDEDLREVLESGSGLEAGRDFHLAFSPEREDPGNPDSKVGDRFPRSSADTPRPAWRRRRRSIPSAVKTVVPVSSCRVAEATKLLENIFRSVNIALVNELKVVYGAMGIDVWEVINAAQDQAVRLHAVLSRAGPGRALHPDRPVLSHLEGARVRPEHAVHRAGGRDQHRHAQLRRAPRRPRR